MDCIIDVDRLYSPFYAAKSGRPLQRLYRTAADVAQCHIDYGFNLVDNADKERGDTTFYLFSVLSFLDSEWIKRVYLYEVLRYERFVIGKDVFGGAEISNGRMKNKIEITTGKGEQDKRF